MGFFNEYPYTDFHELNLDWVINQVKSLESVLKDFIKFNTIKYANPILWDITSQYEANTVVVNGQTGDAFISIKPVPAGVDITTEEYWTAIFNYDNQLQVLRSSVAGLASDLSDEISNRTAAIAEEVTAREEYIVYSPTGLVATNSNTGLKTGTYTLSNNLTISGQIVVPNGAIINVPEGITLTLNGEIVAGRYRIFRGDGNIIVNSRINPVGYPEWFGAVPNGSVDCTTAIQRCIDIFQTVEFSNGIYTVSDTIKVKTSNKTLKGKGIWRTSSNGTTIMMNNASSVVLQLGPDTKPSEINVFPQDIRVENLEVARNTEGWTSSSIGILCQFILRSNLVDVMSKESGTNFYIQNCVYTRFIRCTGFSTCKSTGDMNRQYRGFRLTANESMGTAGGNASIYLVECSATAGGVILPESWGVQAYGSYGIADIYIDKLESNGVAYGITLQGTNNQTSSRDIIVTNCVLDGIGLGGIDVTNMAYGNITIANNYVALGAVTTGTEQFALRLQSVVGAAVSNNQFLGIVATGSVVRGLRLISCRNVHTHSNMICEFKVPVIIATSKCCKIEDIIDNQTINPSAYGIRIDSSSERIVVNSTIIATCSAAVSINTGCTKCEVDVSGIDASTVTNIATSAGTPVTAIGKVGNNYFTGYFA